MSCFIFKSKSAIYNSYSGDSMHRGQKPGGERTTQGDIHVTIQIDNEALASKAMCTAFSWCGGTYKRSMHLTRFDEKNALRSRSHVSESPQNRHPIGHRMPRSRPWQNFANFAQPSALRSRRQPRLVLLIQDDLFHIRHAG